MPTPAPGVPAAPHRVGPRLELKYSLAADETAAMLAWARERFRPDPHARDPGEARIRVTSLYFDSPVRACYRGRSRNKLPKYRLRRYDGESALYLEEKLRLDDRVWKRRLVVPQEELCAVTQGREPLRAELEWFRSRFRTLNLQATILLEYQRRAFVADGEARITFDQDITAARVDAGSCVLEAEGPLQPVGRQTIVEIKGPHLTTEAVRAAVDAMDRTVCEYSKYSSGLEAVGLELAAPHNDSRG